MHFETPQLLAMCQMCLVQEQFSLSVQEGAVLYNVNILISFQTADFEDRYIVCTEEHSYLQVLKMREI